MNWVYRNRIEIFLASCGFSAIAYLLFLCLDLLRLSALMILIIFSCSLAATKLGVRNLEKISIRFRQYFFAQQMANQYLLRSLGFFMVLYKSFTDDSRLIQLALACITLHLITMFIVPTFSGRAFRIEAINLGFPESKASNARNRLVNPSTSILESSRTIRNISQSTLEPLHIIIFFLSLKETKSILIWTLAIHIIINLILLTYSLIALVSTFLSQSLNASKEKLFKKYYLP